MGGKILLITGGALLVGGTAMYLKKQYDLSQNIEFSFSGLKIVNLSLTGLSRFNADFDIINKGDLKLDVKNLAISIYAGKNYLTTINKPSEVTIVPNGKTLLDSGFSLNLPQVIRDGIAEVKSANDWKNIPLTFKGSIKVKQFGIWINVPFKFTYKIAEMMP